MYSVLLFPISALYGVLGLLLRILSAFLVPSIDPNDGIHLAVSPRCGPLSGTASDFNAGLNLPQFKTIVAFGDSFTDGGRHDGGPLEPAVIIPPNILAGGRSTNGPVWVEGIASDIGARVMDYAVCFTPQSVHNLTSCSGQALLQISACGLATHIHVTSSCRQQHL
jgi:hypothetical protein